MKVLKPGQNVIKNGKNTCQVLPDKKSDKEKKEWFGK